MATLEDKVELLEALEHKLALKAREDFATFVSSVECPGAPIAEDDEGKFYPERLKPAEHHKLIIQAVQELADGAKSEIDGIMIFCPPGAAKSTYASVLAPAWLLGRRPGTNIIAASYAQSLADRFGRRVRYIARSSDFSRLMGCTITGDNQAVGEWSLTNQSDYRAAGLDAGFAGVRADFFLIDDPVRNREDADSDLIREKTWDGFQDNVQTRLKPGGKILIIQTRWSEDDLSGRLLGEDWKGQSGLWRGTDGRLWKIINLPLLAEHKDDPLGRKEGEILWPSWFRTKDAERLQEAAKKGGSAARTWSSLYQQRPRPSEGAILSRDYWKPWTKDKIPECQHVFLCYDTAFEEGEENDFSGMSAWGVFENTSKKDGGYEYHHSHVIMLGAWQEKVNSIDLLDKVKWHAKLFRPDRILVEKRASGIQLIQEMQRLRLPVKAWLPPGKPGAKGKIPRAHAVAAILEQGSVWYVPGKRTDQVIDQCAAFPYGRNDDLVDTVTMALSWFRRAGLMQTSDDELDKAELEEAMIKNTNDRRVKRSLYSGPIDRGRYSDDEDDSGPLRNMTSETKRRLYGN